MVSKHVAFASGKMGPGPIYLLSPFILISMALYKGATKFIGRKI